MRTLLAREGAFVGTIYVCTDTEIAPHYRRKPAPGMLLEAMRDQGVRPQETIFIGDALRDLQAAASAGCIGILVKTGRGQETLGGLKEDFGEVPVYDTLYDAVDAILSS
jgi:D-glycero-D-manno-heptose 1,7-bisphosphate phosphatase